LLDIRGVSVYHRAAAVELGVASSFPEGTGRLQSGSGKKRGWVMGNVVRRRKKASH
jgi:hypothetical protein